MNWKHLKYNKCPQCGKSLLYAIYDNLKTLFKCQCGFNITEEKINEIVVNKVKKDIELQKPIRSRVWKKNKSTQNIQ